MLNLTAKWGFWATRKLRYAPAQMGKGIYICHGIIIVYSLTHVLNRSANYSPLYSKKG